MLIVDSRLLPSRCGRCGGWWLLPKPIGQMRERILRRPGRVYVPRHPRFMPRRSRLRRRLVELLNLGGIQVGTSGINVNTGGILVVDGSDACCCTSPPDDCQHCRAPSPTTATVTLQLFTPCACTGTGIGGFGGYAYPDISGLYSLPRVTGLIGSPPPCIWQATSSLSSTAWNGSGTPSPDGSGDCTGTSSSGNHNLVIQVDTVTFSAVSTQVNFASNPITSFGPTILSNDCVGFDSGTTRSFTGANDDCGSSHYTDPYDLTNAHVQVQLS